MTSMTIPEVRAYLESKRLRLPGTYGHIEQGGRNMALEIAIRDLDQLADGPTHPAQHQHGGGQPHGDRGGTATTAN